MSFPFCCLVFAVSLPSDYLDRSHFGLVDFSRPPSRQQLTYLSHLLYYSETETETETLELFTKLITRQSLCKSTDVKGGYWFRKSIENHSKVPELCVRLVL